MATATIMAETSFKLSAGTSTKGLTKGNGYDKTIETASHDYTNNAFFDAALPHQGLSDDKAGKSYGHHTCAQINVAGTVVLRQKAT